MEYKKVIYFHGFGGENSSKFQTLKNYFEPKGIDVVMPRQTYNWEFDREENKKLIDPEEQPLIVASSLGCIYAIQLSMWWSVPCVLINPSYFPERTLRDLLTQDQLKNLLKAKDEIESHIDRFQYYKTNLFLARDDERLDFKDFLMKFKRFRYVKYFENKGHSFKNLEQNMPEIERIWHRYGGIIYYC